jgi:hypothetical protein
VSTGLNRVFCHRKSGASYVIRSVLANFYCNDFDKCHWNYQRAMDKAMQASEMTLYVVRDGRDVLIDMYNYLKEQPGTKGLFTGSKSTFRHYLMGYIEPDNDLFDKTAETKNPLYRDMFTDPVQYWVGHVEGYIECTVDKLYFVNYDMMLIDGASMLMHLGEYFNLEPRNKLIEPLEDLIVYKPLLKDCGQWRSVFGEKDMDFFWSRAEETMVKLKYSYT